MGPYQRTPDQVSCDRAVRYSGFFGVRSFVGPTVGDFLEKSAKISQNKPKFLGKISQNKPKFLGKISQNKPVGGDLGIHNFGDQ